MGDEIATEVQESAGLYADAALQAYVSEIGMAIASVSERPDLPWSFAVLDTPTPNAVAAPGGHVFVTRGLLALLNSEAQLASVLAHEVAHVSARHAMRAKSKEVLNQRFRVEGVFGGVGALSRHVQARRQFANSREAELEADALAVQYLRASGYEPRALAQTVHALQDYTAVLEAKAEADPDGGELEDVAGPRERERDEVPRWAQTHPAPDERVLELGALMSESDRGELREDAYLARIDGLVYGSDPRKGYFDGDDYVHPNRGYTVSLPREWTAVSNGDAMLAVPESAGVDALMVWFDAEQSNIRSARKKFFEDTSLPRGATWTRNLGDSESIAVGIGGQSSLGTLFGMVGFTEIKDVVMVMVVIAPASQWETLGPVAFDSFSSLRVEPNPARVQVAPVRLRLIERPPSGIDASVADPVHVSELRALNQLAQTGGKGVGASGSRLKRLVGTWPGR
jgi:predicted Zn-dependent protease